MFAVRSGLYYILHCMNSATCPCVWITELGPQRNRHIDSNFHSDVEGMESYCFFFQGILSNCLAD